MSEPDVPDLPDGDPFAVPSSLPARPPRTQRSRLSTVLLVVCSCLAVLTGLFVIAGVLIVYGSLQSFGNK